MEDTTNKLSFFFLGLGIGVAVGILFAPKSGEETRGLIRDKAGEGKDFLKRRSGELRETAADALERGKSAVTRQKDQFSAAVAAGRQAYREVMVGEGEQSEPKGI